MDGEITEWPIFPLMLQETYFSFYNEYSSFNDPKINGSFSVSGKLKIWFAYGELSEPVTSKVLWICFLCLVLPSSSPITAKCLASLTPEAPGQTIDSNVWVSILLSPVLLPACFFFLFLFWLMTLSSCLSQNVGVVFNFFAPHITSFTKVFHSVSSISLESTPCLQLHLTGEFRQGFITSSLVYFNPFPNWLCREFAQFNSSKAKMNSHLLTAFFQLFILSRESVNCLAQYFMIWFP